LGEHTQTVSFTLLKLGSPAILLSKYCRSSGST